MGRYLAVMLAGVLGGQCLFAYQPEKTIWAERRAAARSARPVLVASRSDGTPSSSPLAAQFPTVQSVHASLSPSISRSLPTPFCVNMKPFWALYRRLMGLFVKWLWAGRLGGGVLLFTFKMFIKILRLNGIFDRRSAIF
ncbi:MAG: hypothetical protein IPN19_10410 [Elusimicrobia bacterium]|nr:hypothetical protein [Elusimicrobiota bacterium]